MVYVNSEGAGDGGGELVDGLRGGGDDAVRVALWQRQLLLVFVVGGCGVAAAFAGLPLGADAVAVVGRVGDEFADLDVNQHLRAVVFGERVGVGAAVAGGTGYRLAQHVAQVVAEGVGPVVAFVDVDAAVFVVADEVFVVIVVGQLGVADGGRRALPGRGGADVRAQAVVGVRDAAAGGEEAGEGGDGKGAHFILP